MAGVETGNGDRRGWGHRGTFDEPRARGRGAGGSYRGAPGVMKTAAHPTIPCDRITAIDVACAAQLACLLEVSAPKPGNVSPGRHFADTRYEDFLASAAAIGAPLGEAGIRPVGQTIRRAIESTARWTRSNTNLGIVLLLAPLARAAAAESGSDPGDGGHRGQTPEFQDSRSETARDSRLQKLRTAVGHTLQSTTVEDARDVYAAIRLAAPGGLGRAEAQDVAG